jgi:prepilin-type N-terminal cleavage/methylation domain-containing protein
MTMASRSTTRRAGMTLVELLVVVAIIGLLAVTVLPTLSTTAESRRTRETTRVITSFIAQKQAQAFGHANGAGFGLVKTGTSMELPALDVVPAVIPETYRGDTPTASVVLSAPTALSFSGAFSSGPSCTNGDLIRFGGRGPWYSLIASGSGAPTACRVRSSATVDALAGQTELNTPWPAFSVRHSFEIVRGPQRAGSGISIGSGRCIDIFWSFAGATRLATDVPTPATVFFMFDAAGRIRQVSIGPNRFSPDGPILLLVGRVDRAGQDPVIPLPTSGADDTIGANWQYADSEWILIDPLSGVTKSAPSVLGSVTVGASQDYVKSTMIMGAR